VYPHLKTGLATGGSPFLSLRPGGGPNAALAGSTLGVVFFATPHFGNDIAAAGWKLRYLPGAYPAVSLARLAPGASI
jgi:hypothetical protein